LPPEALEPGSVHEARRDDLMMSDSFISPWPDPLKIVPLADVRCRRG